MSDWPAHVRIAGAAWGFELRCQHCATIQDIFARDGLPLPELAMTARYFAAAHAHAEDTA